MRFHGLTNLFNKFIRQFVGHIQPEAGGSQPQPGIDDAALAADEFFIGRRIFLHFGQRFKAPPAAITAGIAGIEIIPAAVGRMAVTVSAAGAIAALAVEVHRIGTCMAEHTIQNDADPLLLGSGAQGGEILVGAQQRVRFQVVGRIVTMVGVRLKDGVEVNAGDTQIPQVGQFLLNTRKIAAVVIHIQVAVILLSGPEIGLPSFVCPINAIRKGHRLVGHTLAETVGENLVHGTVAEPRGRLEIRFVDGQLPAGTARPAEYAFPAGAAVNFAEIGVQVKVVKVQSRRGGCNGKGKMVHLGCLAIKIHAVVDGVLPVFGQNQVRVHIAQVFRNGQMKSHFLPGAHRSKRRFAGRIKAVVKCVRHTKPPVQNKNCRGQTAAAAKLHREII